MTRTTAARQDDREIRGVIEFDAAFEAYLIGDGDSEDLLCAAALVAGSTIPLNPERAETIADLTGTTYELVDYDDAGRAIRRWFAAMCEPGPRH